MLENTNHPDQDLFLGENSALAADEDFFDDSLEEEFTYTEAESFEADERPKTEEKKKNAYTHKNNEKRPNREETRSEGAQVFVSDALGREDAFAFSQERRAMEQARYSALGELEAALKHHTLFKTSISGTQIYQGEAYWCCYEGPATIMIPVDQSFMTLPSNLLRKAEYDTRVLKAQIRFLDRAVGAQIKVVITKRETSVRGDTIYFASRTTALAVERRHYFGNEAKKPLTLGQEITAQVITTGPSSAHLTFCGIDAKVYVSALTHRYIPNVSEEYQPGDKIRVKVVYIKEEPGRIPSVGVTGRPCELAQKKWNLHRVTDKLRTIGTVTSIKVDPSGKTTISLYLDEMDLPAFSTVIDIKTRTPLETGNKVQFECRGTTTAGYVHGHVVRFIRKR